MSIRTVWICDHCEDEMQTAGDKSFCQSCLHHIKGGAEEKGYQLGYAQGYKDGHRDKQANNFAD